jgi:hypothetical protein
MLRRATRNPKRGLTPTRACAADEDSVLDAFFIGRAFAEVRATRRSVMRRTRA